MSFLGDTAKGIVDPLGIVDKLRGGDDVGMRGAEMSEDTSKMIDRIRDRSRDDSTQDYLRGVDQTGAVKGAIGADAMRSNAALGGYRPTSDAIQARASRNYGQDVNTIKRQAELAEPVRRFDRVARAQQLSQEKYKVSANLINAKMQSDAQNQANRQKAIGSILGTAGMVGGMMVGAPPVGMMNQQQSQGSGDMSAGGGTMTDYSAMGNTKYA